MSSEPSADPYRSDFDETIQTHEAAQEIAGAIARWQRFMALLLIAAFIMILGFFFVLSVDNGSNTNWSSASASLACTGVLLLLCFVLPAILLWRAANSALKYSQSGTLPGLGTLIGRQLELWRSLGILVLVLVGLWLSLMLLGLFGASLFGAVFVGCTTGIFAG